jgi:hypothetical protein
MSYEQALANFFQRGQVVGSLRDKILAEFVGAVWGAFEI